MQLSTLKGAFLVVLFGDRVEVPPAVACNTADIPVVLLDRIGLLLFASPEVGSEEENALGGRGIVDLGFLAFFFLN